MSLERWQEQDDDFDIDFFPDHDETQKGFLEFRNESKSSKHNPGFQNFLEKWQEKDGDFDIDFDPEDEFQENQDSTQNEGQDASQRNMSKIRRGERLSVKGMKSSLSENDLNDFPSFRNYLERSNNLPDAEINSSMLNDFRNLDIPEDHETQLYFEIQSGSSLSDIIQPLSNINEKYYSQYRAMNFKNSLTRVERNLKKDDQTTQAESINMEASFGSIPLPPRPEFLEVARGEFSLNLLEEKPSNTNSSESTTPPLRPPPEIPFHVSLPKLPGGFERDTPDSDGTFRVFTTTPPPLFTNNKVSKMLDNVFADKPRKELGPVFDIDVHSMKEIDFDQYREEIPSRFDESIKKDRAQYAAAIKNIDVFDDFLQTSSSENLSQYNGSSELDSLPDPNTTDYESLDPEKIALFRRENDNFQQSIESFLKRHSSIWAEEINIIPRAPRNFGDLPVFSAYFVPSTKAESFVLHDLKLITRSGRLISRRRRTQFDKISPRAPILEYTPYFEQEPLNLNEQEIHFIVEMLYETRAVNQLLAFDLFIKICFDSFLKEAESGSTDFLETCSFVLTILRPMIAPGETCSGYPFSLLISMGMHLKFLRRDSSCDLENRLFLNIARRILQPLLVDLEVISANKLVEEGSWGNETWNAALNCFLFYFRMSENFSDLLFEFNEAPSLASVSGNEAIVAINFFQDFFEKKYFLAPTTEAILINIIFSSVAVEVGRDTVTMESNFNFASTLAKRFGGVTQLLNVFMQSRSRTNRGKILRVLFYHAVFHVKNSFDFDEETLLVQTKLVICILESYSAADFFPVLLQIGGFEFAIVQYVFFESYSAAGKEENQIGVIRHKKIIQHLSRKVNKSFFLKVLFKLGSIGAESKKLNENRNAYEEILENLEDRVLEIRQHLGGGIKLFENINHAVTRLRNVGRVREGSQQLVFSIIRITELILS